MPSADSDDGSAPRADAKRAKRPPPWLSVTFVLDQRELEMLPRSPRALVADARVKEIVPKSLIGSCAH